MSRSSKVSDAKSSVRRDSLTSIDSRASDKSITSTNFNTDGAYNVAKSQAESKEEVRCSFFDPNYAKPTLADYKQRGFQETKLFPKVMTLDSDDRLVQQDAKDDSILVTGFGVRNLKSLQEVLMADEKKRLFEIYRQKQKLQEQEEKPSISSLASSSSSRKSDFLSSKSTETETEITSIKSDLSAQKFQLNYLLGLQTLGGEEYSEAIAEKKEEEEDEDRFAYSTSISMKNAQKYLRVHRIFDFFQFIIAHLLGAAPENPIAFILELLNKCLLYRSGLGKPPLLYDKKHITQLFLLMDRMRTGFIDQEQYKKGLGTLGICEYNTTPPLTPDGLIEQKVFEEEAYESELDLFDDLIRRKWMGKKPQKAVEDGLISADQYSRISTGPYFIPSDLFKSLRKKKETIIKQEEEYLLWG